MIVRQCSRLKLGLAKQFALIMWIGFNSWWTSSHLENVWTIPLLYSSNIYLVTSESEVCQCHYWDLHDSFVQRLFVILSGSLPRMFFWRNGLPPHSGRLLIALYVSVYLIGLVVPSQSTSVKTWKAFIRKDIRIKLPPSKGRLFYLFRFGFVMWKPSNTKHMEFYCNQIWISNCVHSNDTRYSCVTRI